MKTLVISLKREKERRQFMLRQMAMTGLDYQFIEAADYTQIGKEGLEKFCHPNSLATDYTMTGPMYCCAYSHVLAYQYMVSNNLPYCLIVEDDAVLPPHLVELLTALEKIIAKNEVISLFCHSNGPVEISSKCRTLINAEYELVYPVNIRQVRSTVAYVISLASAKGIIQKAFPIYCQSDSWGRFYEYGAINSFRIVNPQYCRTAHFSSTIGKSSVFNSFLTKNINRIQVPILYSFLQHRAKRMQEKQFRFFFSDDPPFNFEKTGSDNLPNPPD